MFTHGIPVLIRLFEEPCLIKVLLPGLGLIQRMYKGVAPIEEIDGVGERVDLDEAEAGIVRNKVFVPCDNIIFVLMAVLALKKRVERQDQFFDSSMDLI